MMSVADKSMPNPIIPVYITTKATNNKTVTDRCNSKTPTPARRSRWRP